MGVPIGPVIDPLLGIRPDHFVATLPKVDLHVHAEAGARLDRVLARRQGRLPYDWRAWVKRVRAEVLPGLPRLGRMGSPLPAADTLDADPANFVARVADVLEEAGADGAILVEIRFGRDTVLRPDFMALVREAERLVQRRYPQLRAEAISTLPVSSDAEQTEPLLNACIAAARDGLAGIDFLPDPYETEADWTTVHRWAERAAEAGLGITAHAGEFSPVNLAAAVQLPGLTRIGHAVHAAHDPRLLEELACREITVECCLTSNVVLGAVPSYRDHPIRVLAEHGIPVTLATDDPVRLCTTIGREYAIAAALDFSRSELLTFTRNALDASFTGPARRTALRAELRPWEALLSSSPCA